MDVAGVDSAAGSCIVIVLAAQGPADWKYKTDQGRYLTATIPCLALVAAAAGMNWILPNRIAAAQLKLVMFAGTRCR